jgi:hypothetical protein
VLETPWPEPIFLFQLDLDDVANNIKHYANIDHGMSIMELSMSLATSGSGGYLL